MGLKKKERLMMDRDADKLRANLSGLRDMKRLPDAMFVIDPDRETIAVSEANRLKIPVIAVVDTNCDPDRIAYCIPGNDDAIRAIRLFCGAIADSVLAGRAEFEERKNSSSDLGFSDTAAAASAAAGGDLAATADASADAAPADEAAAAEKTEGDTPAAETAVAPATTS